MAIALVEVPDRSGDATTAWLDDILTGLAAAVDTCADLGDAGEVADADRIDRIARLERVKAAAGALQAAESVRFARSQVEQQWADDVDPQAIGRGIADQLALAGHVPPTQGSRRLETARALWFDLPQARTYELLVHGLISEYVASLVVSETRHLDSTLRGQVDRAVVAAGLEHLGTRAAAARARKEAYRADPAGYTQRVRTERQHRRVTLRPAPDTMALLTGYLPVEQGVACLAALRQHTDTAKAFGDTRSWDQIMADTLVERVTGQTAAADVNVEVQFTMPLASLLDPDDPSPTTVAGHGPLPGPIAREILCTSQGRKWWRRLFTGATPRTDTTRTDTTRTDTTRTDTTSTDTTSTDTTSDGGPLIGGDPQRRRFDGWLAQLIELRDQTCRDPFCDAAIRQLDHINPYRHGGPTTFTNGRGVCERGNYVRELPGWTVETLDDGLDGSPHRIRVTTPTGHTYDSRAPQPP